MGITEQLFAPLAQASQLAQDSQRAGARPRTAAARMFVDLLVLQVCVCEQAG